LFIAAASAAQPSLWLYADRDSFYSLPHSRANFAAFAAAGGTGELREFTRGAGAEGHFLINEPTLWGDAVAVFLDRGL
jgi:hypothetical protein